MSFAIDWREIFVPQSALIEALLRGTIMYAVLFLALRYLLKRNTSQIGIADLLVVLLVTEVSQNALVGEAKSIPEAMVSIGTILAWSYAINWMSFRIPGLATLTSAKPLTLVEAGRLNRGNMRDGLITYDELMSQMRQHGIEHLAQVRFACLEGDGTFSFIREDGGEVDDPQPRRVG